MLRVEFGGYRMALGSGRKLAVTYCGPDGEWLAADLDVMPIVVVDVFVAAINAALPDVARLGFREMAI